MDLFSKYYQKKWAERLDVLWEAGLLTTDEIAQC